jgi:hypothetical protein
MPRKGHAVSFGAQHLVTFNGNERSHVGIKAMYVLVNAFAFSETPLRRYRRPDAL